MDNHKKWYQKLWVWIVIGVTLILIFGIPWIINECYIPNKGYMTVWGGEDVLQYCGSALTLISTIILGILTLTLNNRAVETNERILNLEMKSKIGYFIPKMQETIKLTDGFTSYKVQYPYNPINKGLDLFAKGEDNIYALRSEVYVESKMIASVEANTFYTPNEEYDHLIVPFGINEDEQKLKELHIRINLLLENSKRYRYYQDIDVVLEKGENSYTLKAFNTHIYDA